MVSSVRCVYIKYLIGSNPDLCLLPYFDLDRWVAGSRIVVGVVSLSNTLYPLLSTGSTQGMSGLD